MLMSPVQEYPPVLVGLRLLCLLPLRVFSFVHYFDLMEAYKEVMDMHQYMAAIFIRNPVVFACGVRCSSLSCLLG